jgi:hypothetical protein
MSEDEIIEAPVGEIGGDESDLDDLYSLREELSTLRAILGRAAEATRQGSDEEFSRMAALAVKAADSITRALLAQSKLGLADDKMAAMRAEFDRTLQEMGYGTETPGHIERSGT